MRALIFLFALMTLPMVHAAPVSDARFEALASMPRWQALMHVNHGATWRGVGESYVDDPDFFLADDGVHDPAAELRSSWRALREPRSAARCDFPARYRFLSENLGWQEAEPLAHCSEYLEWRAKMPIGQLVLVFPAAYLNSPSSMFGHTLLRLDESPQPESVWLSRAINFGAQTGGDENSFFYIWRGLAGGYPGRFSVVSYVKKIREYAFVENRDLWEYALNLKPDELDWLVRHLWELRDTNFDYYFFDENCSFRLLELIKVGRPDAPLLQDYRFAELPANTVRALYDADLVTERRYRPSKAGRLEHHASRLNDDELALAKTLMRDPQRAESARFRAQDPTRRHLVAKVAYQALRLKNRKGPRNDAAAGASLALLRLVQRNPAPPEQPMPAPAAPETGHDTEMVSVGGGRRGSANFAEFGYRLTYHDILDPVTGFPPGAGIEGLDIRLRYTDTDGLDLETLDLVNIRSLAPRGAFVKPISWFVHAGLEQTPVRDDRSLGLFLQGGPGVSWQAGDLMPYAFTVGRAETVSGEDPSVALGGGGEIGAVYAAPDLQLGASARLLYFDQGFYRQRTRISANLPVSTNNAVRAACERDTWRDQDETECQLELRHYFN